MKQIKLKNILVFLFCLSSFSLPSSCVTAYTKQDLQNIQDVSNFLGFVGFVFDSKVLSLPSYATSKIMESALENENKQLEAALVNLFFGELLNYLIGHMPLTSYTNFLVYLEAQPRDGRNRVGDGRDRIAHLLARVLRKFTSLPLLRIIEKKHLYNDQRVLHRLVRIVAHALPSIIIGLGETVAFEKLHPAALNTWDNFGKLALADVGQHAIAEFLGELVIQGAE